ncbi:hypothetical protein Syun_004431 [Stephania yunnanensis]|uniref:Uncharacterized protein n=1 Tax=Stephania yunnanensis TaxID=152371 RepID=A0AAP0L765_9MAGN
MQGEDRRLFMIPQRITASIIVRQSFVALNDLQQNVHVHSLMTLLTEALMSKPNETNDLAKLESSQLLKGKNAAIVVCQLLRNGSLLSWGGVNF